MNLKQTGTYSDPFKSDISRALDRILRRVERPGRYVGGEVHQVVKNPDEIRVSIALAFPDVYDIGMSYHGYKILYERVNQVEDWAAERTFAPWPDMEGLMREQGIPLFSLESKRRVRDFDLIGFTLQHEVNYTNILNMIDLAGLPVEAEDRPEVFPLVIGGGEGALAPEPLALFFDLFVVGDGEEILEKLMQEVQAFKAERGSDKQDLLKRLKKIPGIYVPSLYEVEYGEEGRFQRLFPLGQPESKEPVVIPKAIYDLRRDPGPLKSIVPNLRVVHDRLSIEIMRGCTRGCRFCMAGMITRPVRERTPDQIVEIAKAGLHHTGFDNIALMSLSSADYSCILPTVRLLGLKLQDQRISISLPSLRINAFDVELAEEIAQVRKTGFTFAPEAGTDRLRKVINKGIDQEDFLNIVDQVCQKGWKTLKFYFMIGLPTETDEDLDGIVDLVQEAERIGKRYWGRGLRINVGLSPFVPKPHTPFQWFPQVPLEELQRRFHSVSRRLRSKVVWIKGGDLELSFIEAVLARGDRKVGRALWRAWRLGARFDGWDEHFRQDLWMQAFQEEGIDPSGYANRERSQDEPFPWDHIGAGLGRSFLWGEWQLALDEKEVPDCRTGNCAGCEVCEDDIQHRLAIRDWQSPKDLDGSSQVKKKMQNERNTLPPVQKLRFRYSRLGDLKYISHLDVIKVLQMACLRASLNPSYSEGFHPTPRMGFLPPLPLGFQSMDEVFDLQLTCRIDPNEARERLGPALPNGIEIRQVDEIPLRSSSPEASLLKSDFKIIIPVGLIKDRKLTSESVLQSLNAFLQATDFHYEKPAKKGPRQVNLKKSLIGLGEPRWTPEGDLHLSLTLSHEGENYVEPLKALSAVLGVSLSFAEGAEVIRTACHLEKLGGEI